MSDFPETPEACARLFAARRGCRILLAPARGLHGDVLETSRSSILKAFGRREAFEAELRVYRRLEAAAVERVGRFHVPVLLGVDERLGVLEITRVQPPYALDFAAVTLDRTPEEVWADQPGRIQAAWARAEEAFSGHTPAQWAEVERLYEQFGERFGVWMLDLHPGNIAFEAEGG